ncbi:MAG: hypothetical protein IKE15_00790 [Clostridia bacterium]|nr:hypothetical protein [Clostridia bacterium]
MKSTYKLLTIYLDRKPLPSVAPVIVDAGGCSCFVDIREEPTLLDYLNGTRTVSGRWMLRQDSIEMLNIYINRLLNCQKLYCLIDYCSESIIANRIFIKRMLQMLGIIQTINMDISLQFAAPKDKIALFQQISDELYS